MPVNHITLSLSGLSRPPSQRYHAGPWPTALEMWPVYVRADELNWWASANRKRGMPSGCADAACYVDFTWK